MSTKDYNSIVRQNPAYSHPITDVNGAKAFFRLIWRELEIDFTPDDDFAGYGVFDDDLAEMLNQRMDESHTVLKGKIYDTAFGVMEEG